MLNIILVLAILYCAYYLYKYKRAVSLLAGLNTFYYNLLITLTERQHYKEEDYEKLAKGLYALDQEVFTNHDAKEHNKIWEAICQSLHVPIRYTDFMGNKWVDEEVTKGIAARLYANRHTFLQYIEAVESIRKRNLEIDAKHA